MHTKAAAGDFILDRLQRLCDSAFIEEAPASRPRCASRTIGAAVLCALLPLTAAAQPPPGADVRPLYRYYSPSVVDHMYTATFAEHGCGSGGYAYEGVIGYILQSPEVGTLPLLRYFNSTVQDHFYTSSSTELLPGYVAQGTTGYVSPQQLAGTVAIFRYYDDHPNVTDHLYTTNLGETFPPGTY